MKHFALKSVLASSLIVGAVGSATAFQTGEEFDAFMRKRSSTNTMTCHVRWSDLTGQPEEPGETAMPFLFSYIDGVLWFRGVVVERAKAMQQPSGEVVLAPVDHLLERSGGRLLADQLLSRGGDPEKRIAILEFEEGAVAVFFNVGEPAEQAKTVGCTRYGT